jgi:hypothetical protein
MMLLLALHAVLSRYTTYAETTQQRKQTAAVTACKLERRPGAAAPALERELSTLQCIHANSRNDKQAATQK